jgi:hypothetical protein
MFFFTLALVGGEWLASGSGCFTPGERALGTQSIGILVGPRTSLDSIEKRKLLTLDSFRAYCKSVSWLAFPYFLNSWPCLIQSQEWSPLEANN